ncbi:MAG: coiled-coil domain-containing protein [Pseudomonadota bacterium]
MATITFDTHQFVRKLREQGFSEGQAEALVEALSKVHEDAELLSKKDLKIERAPIQSDIHLIKWMMGLMLGGVTALVLKAFF